MNSKRRKKIFNEFFDRCISSGVIPKSELIQNEMKIVMWPYFKMAVNEILADDLEDVSVIKDDIKTWRNPKEN